MKVAQVTLDGYFNYGNILQKYALQQTLKKFADTEILWFRDNNFFHERGVWDNWGAGDFGQVENPDKYISYEVARVAKIREFDKRYIKTRFDFDFPEDIADEYDYFVVGSDQVWNPNWTEPKYFLPFCPREKRIAYAASLAAPKIPEHMRENLHWGISGFDNISVREEASIKIIKELTGQDSILLADPTLLLTPEEWLKVSRKPCWIDEKYERGYILTYYLRNLPPPELKNLSRELNLPVINLLDYKNYWHYVNGLEEFIWLFANASLIYANSFHGIVFSIIFKKPFVNREIVDDEGGKSMSMRIPSLLKMFGLENRIAEPENNFKIDNLLEVDYSTRDKVLPVEREKAFKFLAQSMKENSFLTISA